MLEIDAEAKNRIAKLSDKDLLKMLVSKPEDYLPEALSYAMSEAHRRGLNDLSFKAITQLEEEEHQQHVELESKSKNRKFELPTNARGLKKYFLICCVFPSFPVARLISLNITLDRPEDFILLFFACGFFCLVVGNILFRNFIAPQKNKTLRGILAAMVMIPALLSYNLYNQIESDLQISHLTGQLERDPSSIKNTPTGYEGATWLMSQSEIRAAFPTAYHFDPDTLSVQTTAFDRPATMGFMFKDNLLLQIVITFNGENSIETFHRTHKLVEMKYGNLSSPRASGQYTLLSEKMFNKVKVQHVLYSFSEYTIEQVILYRTK